MGFYLKPNQSDGKIEIWNGLKESEMYYMLLVEKIPESEKYK